MYKQINLNMKQPNFPTEIIKLPSKGLTYPEGHPFKNGTAEMKYMTAREEDILTNKNFMDQGIILDKLLESLLIAKVDLNSIIPGDRNALLVSSRILGYGKDYKFSYKGKEQTVDLTTLNSKIFPPEGVTLNEQGHCKYILPTGGNVLEFKFLNFGELDNIETELKSLEKLNPNDIPTVTTYLKHRIVSVDGNTDKSSIFEFVRNNFLAVDSREFRKYVVEVSPDVNLTVNIGEEEVAIPINLDFFWPEL